MKMLTLDRLPQAPELETTIDREPIDVRSLGSHALDRIKLEVRRQEELPEGTEVNIAVAAFNSAL